MKDFEFSDDFCRFIQASIPAVAAAELLLILRAHPDVALTAEEALAKLGPGVALGEVTRYLELLAAGGLLQHDERRYRYRTESDFAPHADSLAIAYEQRPVTLIRVIYAFRDTGIKSFADAFKLRR
jgi:hypothetical protein